ncbi:MAG: OmpA family protein [Bacteroidota bacterium]|nr:OmpA family protein [Bacteroidota bacterium]
MKTTTITIAILSLFTASINMRAQDVNLVINGSFENIAERVNSTGEILLADSITSSNNTTVDLFSQSASGNAHKVPENYMGSQGSKTGSNYAGIIAYYADERGVFKTKPGYQCYSEYIQFQLKAPMTAGKAYTINFNVSLAEKSAFAVSGMGVYFSTIKTDVKRNSFMNITPHVVCTDIITGTEWTTVTGTYVAKGGEKFLSLGCFDRYMEVTKVIAPNTNNSRKAYYFIDDVGVAPVTIETNDLAMILSGSCYQLNNLNFETDKSVILPSSDEELKKVARFLRTYPYIVVYIDGFTDKTGTDQHNDKLSKDRAMAVKSFLVKEGVNGNRLSARGFGETLPIDKLNDDSQANRRVELTICAMEPVIESKK